MRNKGFTLIELLAVVTIISLLLLLVLPKITSQLNNSKDEVNEATKKIIYTAAEKYVQDYNIGEEEQQRNEYCLTLKELVAEDYLSDNIKDNKLGINIKEKKSVKITYDSASGFSYELLNSSECDDILNYGLTPVAYKEDKWVVVSSMNKNNEWYDYDNQKWANAVTLLPGVKKEIGDEVAVDGTEASMMLVYIPRFEYKIEEPYGKDGISTYLPGEIEVNFVPKTKKGYDEVSGYRVHPAFTFGDQDVSGFWVGKFELSSVSSNTSENNNLGCNQDGCTSDISKLRILPNVASLRYNNVSNFFYALRRIEKTNSFGLKKMDTHMIKNSEWGAVAYLSQSKYGKYGNKNYTGANKEIYQNKSSSFITGNSNGTPSQNETNTQCSYDNTTNNCGVGASTTGNIYGIYDMSGGSYDYAMGVYGNDSTSINILLFDGYHMESKYYNIYTNDIATTACNGGICYGDALSETNKWYYDYNGMVKSTHPCIVRGGSFDTDVDPNFDTGIFYFSHVTNISAERISTRFVGIIK